MNFLLFFLIMLPVSFSEILFNMYGWYSFPPLTTADTAVTCWIGVTLIPWPKAVVASSTLPTFDRGKMIPLPSPLKSTPVLAPKPNLSK